MMTMRFFMIGSWTEGMVHFQKLIPYITFYETAFIQALSYRLSVGYPILVDEPEHKITGQLIEMNINSTLLSLLDVFHGVNAKDPSKGLYTRKEVMIHNSSNVELPSQVYFFNSEKINKKCQRIENGDWRKSLSEQPPVTEQLSLKQKEYVLKLGSVKGREIVPINDLVLYRELIKLELIVDKGRRLALSPFGKEVYSHLS